MFHFFNKKQTTQVMCGNLTSNFERGYKFEIVYINIKVYAPLTKIIDVLMGPYLGQVY
jgi:hypothetical protein